MIVENSSMQFASQYRFLEKYSIKEFLKISLNTQVSDDSKPSIRKPLSDTIEISDKSRSTSKADSAEGDENAGLTPELRMIKMLLEKMTHKKIKVTRIEKCNLNDIVKEKGKPSSGRQTSEFSVEYNRNETYYQSEKTGFSAKGTLCTFDGKSINFGIKLELSREFLSKDNMSLGIGKPKDPLVINFDGTSAQLTDVKFTFDIDADGESDQISFVNPNNGFLAIDKNSDGKINNGSELFEPITGDGFAELGSYDSDHNNWIDEKDPAYNRLLVWSKDNQGIDALVGVKQMGIGAIYLDCEKTPFEMNDTQGNTQGILKSCGIYVNEAGSGGLIQQLDLVT